MALNLKKKKNIINKINKIAQLAVSATIATTHKINVNFINKLRKISRENNVIVYVIKNTLLKLSLKKTNLECINNKLIGPNLIGFSLKDPGNETKLFYKCSKENKNFKIVTAAFQGKVLSETEINYLANLPTFQESILKFILTIKTATIGKLFSILLSIKNKKDIK